MPQLHFYVPEEVAERIRRNASRKRVPVSKYLAQVVTGQVSPAKTWPKDYFTKVLGAWKGADIQRPTQGELRDPPRFD